MPRRGFIAKRELLADPIYGNKQVTQFINRLMLSGKKGIAESIFYDAMGIIAAKSGKDPMEVFQTALKNVMPVLEVKPRRVGGATYQVPIEVRPERRLALAIRWLVNYASNRVAEKTMKEKLKKLGLRNYVSFKKNLSEKKLVEEYRQCDVFVMPSEYEAFSITTLEALSAGAPVIVSKVGFLKEISKGNGYTIESQVDLTLALLKVIENGVRVNFNFRKYSWDRIAQETERIYN